MIDLHCHILSNCDDGPKELTTSLKLAKEAVNQGIDKMLLTPHHMDGHYINHKSNVIQRTKWFQEKLNQHNIPLEVYPGQEVHLTGNLISAIDNNDILFADEKHKYLILELPTEQIPTYFSQIRFELKYRGITPIIVHPERNLEFLRNPDKLYQLVSEGCLTQLTSSSYVGDFGKKLQKFSNQVIDAGLCNTFSSDAHGINHRNITMQSAYYKLSKRNRELPNKYKKNAYYILLGDSVNSNSIKKISKDNKLKHFINKLF